MNNPWTRVEWEEMNTEKIRKAINNPPGVPPEQAYDWLHEALDEIEQLSAERDAFHAGQHAAEDEIDRLENANLNLRENVDLLRREKAAFAERVKQLENEVSILRGLSQEGTIDRGSFADYADGETYEA